MNWKTWLLFAGGAIMPFMSIGWYVFWSRVFRDLEKSNFEEKNNGNSSN